MKLYAALYGMIWLILLEILSLMALPRGNAVGLWLHVVLGVAIVILAFVNAREIAATAAPARPKRVARAIFGMSLAAAFFGVLLLLGVRPSFGILEGGPIFVLHLVLAFAVFTQAASVATSYDMWEEKEFEAAAPENKAPAPPEPGAPASSK